MSQWFQSQAAEFYDTGYKSWSHGMTNVSIPEVNMLKDSTTLSVSVPIHLSIKLGFISVNRSGKLTLCTRRNSFQMFYRTTIASCSR